MPMEGDERKLDYVMKNYTDKIIIFFLFSPFKEIVRAFTHLINTDKTFYWGTSRWNSMEIMVMKI